MCTTTLGNTLELPRNLNTCGLQLCNSISKWNSSSETHAHMHQKISSHKHISALCSGPKLGEKKKNKKTVWIQIRMNKAEWINSTVCQKESK